MSKYFYKVENYYRLKLWDINRVRISVGKWITAEEYKIITGQDYISE